ncbi:MBL fold metallo-hydrolase [Methanofollis aquaemaris]|uniref:MBL fold metallo-hydrolase n=1 Tax=Methanofollis aquaemaris TaxID=126734 RepID=A0A8A3S490_9EURY|nr:MBL fold metallo-hydrolase [Methanofollis aquaemaris]QSZ66689.1 MBL fold metallo-hydrolase [Methanofollis aquaemaris]
MAENDWREIPGTDGARILPLTRKPDVCCSNAYLIATEREIVIIDTGADETQMETIISTVEALTAARPRPVCLFITHCHLDHCLQAIRRRSWIEEKGVVVFAHAEGAEALESGDESQTVADIFKWEIEPLRVDVRLHNGDGREVSLGNGETIVLEHEEHAAVPADRLTFPSGNLISVYATPGHSPDSVCIRVGEHLFLGDLLFSANPGVAGLHGWNPDALLTSAGEVRRILTAGGITLCWNGHGREITVPDTLRALGKLEDDLECMKAIGNFDNDRLRESVEYAQDMLAEANRLFPIISGRIYYLSYYLEALGEVEEAERYQHLIESDMIDAFLTDFDAFATEFREGGKIDIQFVLKAVQVAAKIEGAFGRGLDDPAADTSLVRRASRLLTDCLHTVCAFDPPDAAVPVDVVPLMAEFVGRLSDSSHLDEALLAAAEDEDAFRSALAQRIAHLPLFEEVRISFVHDADSLVVRTRPERLCDGLTAVIEGLTAAGAEKIAVSATGTGEMVSLAVQSSVLHGDWPHLRACQRRFARCGGRCDLRTVHGMPALVLDFTREPVSL